jgi:ubiquinol-cytochrome c reductase cytochrome c subunit
MKKLWLLVPVAAAALTLPAFAGAQAPAPGEAANGRRLFEKDGCYECHGYAAQGGRDGPRIAATPLSAQALVRYVRRPSGAMPVFTRKVLSDQDLTDIHAYLKSFSVAKPATDIPLLSQSRDK